MNVIHQGFLLMIRSDGYDVNSAESRSTEFGTNLNRNSLPCSGFDASPASGGSCICAEDARFASVVENVPGANRFFGDSATRPLRPQRQVALMFSIRSGITGIRGGGHEGQLERQSVWTFSKKPSSPCVQDRVPIRAWPDFLPRVTGPRMHRG